MKSYRFFLLCIFLGSCFVLFEKWGVEKSNRADGQSTKIIQSDRQDSSSLPLDQDDFKLQTEVPVNEPDVSSVMKLSNDVLAVDISLLGGQVTHAELKTQLMKDPEHQGSFKPLVLLNGSKDDFYVAQNGLVGNVSENQPGNFPNHQTPMTVLKSSENSLTLLAESGGVRLIRTYVLTPGSYILSVRNQVQNNSPFSISPTLYMQFVRTDKQPEGESKFFYKTFTGPVFYTDAGKFQKINFKDIEKKVKIHVDRSSDGWIGIIQHYFVSAWIPVGDRVKKFYTRKLSEGLYVVGMKEILGILKPSDTLFVDSKLLVGPQDQRMLRKIAPGLDLTVDYGIFTILAQPIYWVLDKIHLFTGNWGWSIIFLTIVIKTIFSPFQGISYRSMKKMKSISPRLEKIRNDFSGDRLKMNQAIMDLYKSEKINPLGGCLPVLIQVPFFISLYWVLLASVEMRNAPWVGWIKDLSSPDPFYILPLVMAASMFVQMMITPSHGDSIQRKAMMVMPIIFSVVFFFFPSGLVLYWIVNNLYSIFQQYLMSRRSESKG